MNTRCALTATASGMAASGIMQTLLANATPRIVDELAAPELYGLVAGSYLIASTVALPLFAQYADRLGPRRIFLTGHLCFVIGTIAMVPAPNMPAFITARIMQGLAIGKPTFANVRQQLCGSFGEDMRKVYFSARVNIF